MSGRSAVSTVSFTAAGGEVYHSDTGEFISADPRVRRSSIGTSATSSFANCPIHAHVLTPFSRMAICFLVLDRQQPVISARWRGSIRSRNRLPGRSICQPTPAALDSRQRHSVFQTGSVRQQKRKEQSQGGGDFGRQLRRASSRLPWSQGQPWPYSLQVLLCTDQLCHC